LVTKKQLEKDKQKLERQLAKAQKTIETQQTQQEEQSRLVIAQDESDVKALCNYHPRVLKYHSEDYSEEALEFSLSKINVPITIVFTADWHYGNVNFATKAWGHFKDDLQKLFDENRGRVWLAGWGDYVDRVKAGERWAMRSPSFKEATRKRWADEIEELVGDLYEELKFTRGKWLGWLEGNHYDVDEYNITTTQKLCDKLGGLYLGKGTWLIATIKNHGTSRTFSITGEHDVGGGGQASTRGTAHNQLYKMRVDNWSEIVVGAHNHVLVNDPVPLKRRRNGQIHTNPESLTIPITGWNINCGGFLMAHKRGEPYYVKMNKGRLILGAVKLTITVRRTKEKRWLDLNAEKMVYEEI